jgi:hypothetical protein
MKKGLMVLTIVILLVLSFVSGYLISSSEMFGGGGDVPDQVEVPVWKEGMYWVYAYSTPDVDHTLAKTVVATIDDENYNLGIDNLVDAQRHAVLNYNPMLGRITKDHLGIYEEGEPQTVLLFPLEVGKSWRFTMLGNEGLDTKVVSIENVHIPGNGPTNIVTIEAKGSSGQMLKYTYDTSARWIRSMVLKSANGEEVLRMTLVSYGEGYSGEVHFIRGVDLYDRTFSSSRASPSVELYDTFIDSGHPNWGPFDSLIYFYKIKTGGNSNGLLTIRDHSTTTSVRKEFGSSADESGLGSVNSNAGEWGVTAVLQGDCDLHLMIAGGITYTWSV